MKSNGLYKTATIWSFHRFPVTRESLQPQKSVVAILAQSFILLQQPVDLNYEM